MIHAPLRADCLGILGLHFPEPADPAFVQRVRAAVAEADHAAHELMAEILEAQIAGETYTRESIVREIREHIDRIGVPPSSAGTLGNRLWRACRKLDLVYGALVAEAIEGLQPQTSGRAAEDPPPVEPEPERTDTPTLAELAQDYETATTELAAAQEGVDLARERLTGHPLFAGLLEAA